MASRFAPVNRKTLAVDGKDHETKIMRLSRPAKLGLIFLTVLPLIYMVLFFAEAFMGADSRGESLVFKHWNLFFAVHLAMMLLGFGLIAIYVVFLFKTAAVKQEQKALWAIVLFMGWPIAAPIFWYLYVWPDAPDSPSDG
jgi:hypothetical protein